MEDAVVVTKDEKGKVKLHQAMNLTLAGATSGGFWGLLIGMIFLKLAVPIRSPVPASCLRRAVESPPGRHEFHLHRPQAHHKLTAPAGVAELVDATDSKSVIREDVWVRVPPPVFPPPNL